MAKKKVVILGGGVSAVTVAMQLTDDPNWYFFLRKKLIDF